MKRVFNISKKKHDDINDWYKIFGCNRKTAEWLSMNVFNCEIFISTHAVDSELWALNYNTMFKKIIHSKNIRNYAEWMKGGWSKSGSWEKPKEVLWSTKSGKVHEDASVIWQYAQNKYLCGCCDSIVDYKSFYNYFAFQKSNEMCKESRLNWVFLIDTSGSMSRHWILVQLAITALFNAVSNRNGVIHIMNCADKTETVADYIRCGDIAAFCAALERVEAFGGFDDQNALKTALKKAEDNIDDDADCHVFMFTDEDKQEVCDTSRYTIINFDCDTKYKNSNSNTLYIFQPSDIYRFLSAEFSAERIESDRRLISSATRDKIHKLLNIPNEYIPTETYGALYKCLERVLGRVKENNECK